MANDVQEQLPALKLAAVQWAYEDDLPEMSDADFDAIFPASRVDTVRMYPFVEDDDGNRIWITHLPCAICHDSRSLKVKTLPDKFRKEATTLRSTGHDRATGAAIVYEDVANLIEKLLEPVTETASQS